MRCYQEIGLKQEAIEWLNENANKIPASVCPKCGEVLSIKLESKEYDFKEMFYEDGAHLREYRLKDGRIAREVVQCTQWSSGPMAFFCLDVENPDGTEERMFEWTAEETEHY